MSMSLETFVSFVREHPFGVVSTHDAERGPEAALVEFAVSEAGDLVLATHQDTRKVANVAGDPRVAAVVGVEPPMSLQVEGRGRLPENDEQKREWEQVYLSAFPDSPAGAPDYTVIRITPTWLRVTDASVLPPAVTEGAPDWSA